MERQKANNRSRNLSWRKGRRTVRRGPPEEVTTELDLRNEKW